MKTLSKFLTGTMMLALTVITLAGCQREVNENTDTDDYVQSTGTVVTGSTMTWTIQTWTTQTTGAVTWLMPVLDDKKEYTLADVQAHATEASCRAIIRESVYDLSAWIEKHPGGDRNILRLCGLDGTALYEGKHGGQEKPEETLGGFKIWVYKRQ